MPSSFGCLLLRPKTPDHKSAVVSRIESVDSVVIYRPVCPRVPTKKLNQQRTSSWKTVKSIVSQTLPLNTKYSDNLCRGCRVAQNIRHGHVSRCSNSSERDQNIDRARSSYKNRGNQLLQPERFFPRCRRVSRLSRGSESRHERAPG